MTISSAHYTSTASATHPVTPGHVIYNGPYDFSTFRASGDTRPFMRRRFLRRLDLHGVVTDVTMIPKYENRTHKRLDAILADEPIEFACTGYEYSIRLQEMPSADGSLSGRRVDVRLYGDIVHEIKIGDEVFIKAKHYILLHKITARKLYNLTTQNRVMPELHIPAGLVKLPLYLVGALFLGLLLMAFLTSEAGRLLLLLLGVLLVAIALPAAGIYFIWKHRGGRG